MGLKSERTRPGALRALSFSLHYSPSLGHHVGIEDVASCNCLLASHVTPPAGGQSNKPGMYISSTAFKNMLYHGADFAAGVRARYINQHSLEMPNGYRTKKVLYRSQVSHEGILASMPSFQTKKPYLTHSVMPHATRIPEKAMSPPFLLAIGLPITLVAATIRGYTPITPQTTISRLATCIVVVNGLARTSPRTECAISRTARVWVKVRSG